MSGFDQVLGQLDDGGTFRATRYVVELRDPEGRLLETYDAGELTDVQRNGRVVTLTRQRGEPITIVAATIDDAGRLTDMVHSALPTAPVPPVAPPTMRADQRVSVDSPRGNQSGCMLGILALVVIALIAALAFVAYDRDWFGSDDDANSATATPAPELTATPEPTPTNAPEPTPTQEPTLTPTPEPEPTETPVPTEPPEPTPTPTP